MLSRTGFAVSILIVALLFVSCALSLDNSDSYGGDSGGDSYADQSYDGSNYQLTDNSQGYDSGQNYGADQDYNAGEGAYDTQYYMDEQPEGSGGLTDLGAAEGTSACPPGALCDIAPGPSQCSIWITDKSGIKKQETMRIPLNKWARLELRTCAKGNLVIYERKTSGVITYDMGPASDNRKYKMWFYADSPGTHTIWFKIGGQKSNEIAFNVGSGSSSGRPPSGGTYSGGTSSGGAPSSGCSVRTDKNAYGLGETVTVYYSVSFPGTVILTIRRPDGVTSTFGPMSKSPGTYSQKGKATEPLGTRTVTLEAIGSGVRCSKTSTFKVETLAYFDQAGGYDQQNSESYDESANLDQGSEDQSEYSAYDQGSSNGQGSGFYNIDESSGSNENSGNGNL